MHVYIIFVCIYVNKYNIYNYNIIVISIYMYNYTVSKLWSSSTCTRNVALCSILIYHRHIMPL